jgi:glucose uptake protein GlcU
MIALI